MKKKIIFISSYPKSGNTWVRILIGSLLNNLDGKFEFDDLKKISMFSQLSNFKKIEGMKLMDDGSLDLNFTIENWIKAQDVINKTSEETKIYKTHNVRGIVNGKYFTDETVCAGFIYIARDPRDIAISKAKYMSTSLDLSIKRMLYDEKITTCPKKVTEFVNTWNNHITSWYSFKSVPRLLIKYEDMLNDTKKILVQIIDFLNEHSTFIINKEDKLIKNVLKTTEFNNLQNMEKVNGFEESTKYSAFFRKGKSNQWEEILSKDQISLIQRELKVPMEYLGYI